MGSEETREEREWRAMQLPSALRVSNVLTLMQVMWLHALFFSMRTWHLGHSFVLAASQMAVASSDFSRTNHLRTRSHGAGVWASSRQRKQK